MGGEKHDAKVQGCKRARRTKNQGGGKKMGGAGS